jgi:hypothetical protein
MSEGLGVSDKEYRGWGCLGLQFLIGGGILALGLFGGTEHVRHGRAASILFGSVILIVVLIRVLLNVIEGISAWLAKRRR